MSQPLHIQVIQTIFRESLDVLLLVDASTGVIINANPAAVRLLGYTENQLTNQHFSILFPNDTTPIRQDVIERLRVSGAVIEAQPFKSLDSTIFPMDVTAALVPWDDGKVIIITLRDVSERLQIEEANQQREILERELQKEREIGELKNRFMTLVSHEFRTPLATILTSTELLERYNDKMSEERRKACITTIKSEVHHLNQMLEDISIIIRAESGHLEFKPVTVDLLQLVRQIIENVQTAYNLSHHISLEYTGDFSGLLLDVTLLHYALQNILTNAVKYTPNGGQIVLRLSWKNESELILEVKDNGIGIPSDEQDKLFQPYYRASNVGEIGGSGLGLKIVRDSIQLHGGTIELESAVGTGTTVRITIPT